LLTTEQGQPAAGTRLKYYAYGAPRPGNAATAAHDAFARSYTPATYTGQTRDPSTGLMYYGARFYDPTLGIFLAPDTIVPQPGNPGALNRYAYTLNNPFKYTDPTGHYVFEENPSDPWIYSDPRVRSQYNYTHPEYEQRQPSDTEIFGTLVAVPVVATGAALVPEVGGVAWTAAQTGWTWLVEILGLACVDGNCTNEVETVVEALTVDGDPTNEVQTGTNVVYRYVENGITRYIGMTNDFARRLGEHLRARGWRSEPVVERLSTYDARAVEQVLIEHYGLANLYNQINSIAASNPIYQGAIQRGADILKQLGILQ